MERRETEKNVCVCVCRSGAETSVILLIYRTTYTLTSVTWRCEDAKTPEKLTVKKKNVSPYLLRDRIFALFKSINKTIYISNTHRMGFQGPNT